MDWGAVTLQIALGVFGGGTIVGLLNFLLTRPKVRAEAAQIATQTTSQMIEDLREHNEYLSTRARNAETQSKSTEEAFEKFKVQHEKEMSEVKTENSKLMELMRSHIDLLWLMSKWQTKAYQELNEESKKRVGPPPSTDGLNPLP